MVNCEQKNLEKIFSNNVNERFKMSKQGFLLDKFVYDRFHKIRKAVAEQGYGFEKLINDVDWEVRKAVAEQGYGLDKLIDDYDEKVKKVARKFKGAKTYVLPYKSGTYNENIYLYIFNENQYEIISYYYSSDSLEQWKEKCIDNLNENVANKLYFIMRKLIEA